MTIDKRATRKRVDYFLKHELIYFLLRYGYTVSDLVDNKIKTKPVNEIALIVLAINSCKPPYKELIVKHYLEEKKLQQVANEMHLSHTTVTEYRLNALNQFATNLVALQEFNHVEPVLDLRIKY